MRARDLLEIFVDFLFRSLVMLVCIILCNKLFTVNHNIKGIYIYIYRVYQKKGNRTAARYCI